MFVFINSYSPVFIPGLLNKKTISQYIINVVIKNYRIGYFIAGVFMSGKGGFVKIFYESFSPI